VEGERGSSSIAFSGLSSPSGEEEEGGLVHGASMFFSALRVGRATCSAGCFRDPLLDAVSVLHSLASTWYAWA